MSAVIGKTGLCYYKGYGYGGNYPPYIDAIDRTVDPDSAPPYIYYDDPDPGETGVDPETDIRASLKDDGFGIDTDTATFEVTYVGSGGPIAGNLTEESGSNFLDYRLRFNPSNPLPENTEITVTVWAEDMAGNDAETVWTFETGELTGIESVSLGELKATFK